MQVLSKVESDYSTYINLRMLSSCESNFIPVIASRVFPHLCLDPIHVVGDPGEDGQLPSQATILAERDYAHLNQLGKNDGALLGSF